MNGKPIPRGQMVPKGSIIDLVLGTESDGTSSPVPSLFGHSLDEAQLTLEEAFLNLGQVSYDESFTSEEQKALGLIWKQNPDSAETFEVLRGTSIDIWLTIDPDKLQEKPEAEKPENSFF
jgi:beta-lactam-binding protein with PASTA domain